MSNELRFDPASVCETCGCFGAYAFDGKQLCAECYEKHGSCCPEFGPDDLWREEAPNDPRPECRRLP